MTNIDSIKSELIDFVFLKSDLDSKMDIPVDKSLLTEGVIDSFGIVELVEYIEDHWSITIDDAEFTVERMGSINKMSDLIFQKKVSI